MKWIDKVAIYLVCSAFLVAYDLSEYTPVVLCVAIIYTCAHYIFSNKYFKLVLLYSFAVLCIFFPYMIYFIPLIAHDNFFKPVKYNIFILLLPILINFEVSISYCGMLVFILLAVFEKYKTNKIDELKSEFNRLRDDSTEFNNLLREKNKQLIINQNYELNMAMLNERNRISKELHDSIGHLLSRSMIQVGALMAVSKEETVQAGLGELKDSLSAGMDSVRETVHNMRDESFDLENKVKEIISGFDFCKINLEYEVKTQPNIEEKYCIVSTIKESLSNVIKHSNATNVYISLMEHPSMYQLVIADNGTFTTAGRKNIESIIDSGEEIEGMGISGMFERVKKLNGIINITIEDGFKIFITMRKKI